MVIVGQVRAVGPSSGVHAGRALTYSEQRSENRQNHDSENTDDCAVADQVS